MSESFPNTRSPEGNARRFKSAAGLRFVALVLFAAVALLNLGGFEGVCAVGASPSALDLGPSRGTGKPSQPRPGQKPEQPSRAHGDRGINPTTRQPARIRSRNARDGEDMQRVQGKV